MSRWLVGAFVLVAGGGCLGPNPNLDPSADTTGDESGEAPADASAEASDDETGGESHGETGGEQLLCSASAECPDTTPLCDAGLCVVCSDAATVACAGELPERPVCDSDSGACVVCTPDDASVCPEAAPACRDHACVPCREHGECPASACELLTGACMPIDHVWWVDQSQAFSGNGSFTSPFQLVSEALALIPPGAHGTVMLATDGPHLEHVLVDAGRVVAIVGRPDGGVGGGLAELVADTTTLAAVDGATVYAGHLGVRGGLGCDHATLAFDDGRIASPGWFAATLFDCDTRMRRVEAVAKAGSGVAAIAGTLALENTILQAQAGQAALTLLDASATLVYVTLAAGVGSAALRCLEGEGELGEAVSIRNSLILTLDPLLPGLDGCAAASVETSALELPLADNLVLGPMDPAWFVGFATGNLRLAAAAPAVLASAARWHPGDPIVDLDGQARPSEPDSPDYAGADRP